jgi:nicotinamidase-related amidase
MAGSAVLNPNTTQDVARVKLQPEKCALIVVDIQEKLLPPIHEKERLVKNAQLLLRMAQVLKLPVLATTQYAKGLGQTVPQIAELLPKVDVIDKVEFGCFANSGFCNALNGLPGKRDTVLLCGMETHICVMQTALGALNQGYAVHVAADAVGSRTAMNWEIGLDRIRTAGAIVSSTETMIYELLGGSGGDAFKQMLPYLKG